MHNYQIGIYYITSMQLFFFSYWEMLLIYMMN